MKIAVVDKSLKIIELLSKNPQGLSLSQIAKMLCFPTSTIHHILGTFRAHDYVSQNPETKKYLLGFKILSISSIILENLDIRKTAYNYLRKLHQTCNETVHLSILRDGKVTYIDKIQKAGGLSLATYIGFRTDPHAAAGGKVLLSELSSEEVRNVYRAKPLRIYGKNTITHMGQLLDELDNIRKQGYAIDNEEYYEGVRCVAAPIRAGGKIVAALSITGSIFTITMERINEELTGLIKKAAEEISSEMSW
jgi:IclR family KDG regulon transcriptional repressor